MSSQAFFYLVEDGIANGAVYGLVAISLLAIFLVTRIMFVPQGDLISYAAMTYAALQSGQVPGVVLLVVALCAVHLVMEAVRAVRDAQFRRHLLSAANVCLPALLASILTWLAPRFGTSSTLLYAFTTVMLVSTLAPLIYQTVFRPIANGSIILLFIVSMACHLLMVGLGLIFFGPGGSQSEPLADIGFSVADVPIRSSTLVTLAVALAIVAALFVVSERTLFGKALRATAIDPLGARLIGVRASWAGNLVFTAAAGIAAVCGILVSSATTVYYDTGFIFGLIGFVAAIFGGLTSFPLALCGALVLGLFESFASFYFSSFKEALVFALIVPIMMFRSYGSTLSEDMS